MSHPIVLECKTAEDAEILRDALRRIPGLEVEDEILAKSAPDFRKLVCFVAATGVIATVSVSAIIAELSALGYTEIKISGKITPLNFGSIEGAIEAKKPSNDHGNGRR